MVQALLESTSERNSMPNKTNLTAKHVATLTHDTLTVCTTIRNFTNIKKGNEYY